MRKRSAGRVVRVTTLLMGCVVASHAARAQAPSPEAKQPWMDTTLSPDRRADLVLAQMTTQEKIQTVHGAGINSPGFSAPDPSIVRSNGGAGFVPGIPRLGLPDLNMADSAVGVAAGSRKGRYSTALPSTLALASSWDIELAHEYGTLIGRELADQGFNVSLGGGVDITREPRNGRNFEYQGEDPILAGNMVAAVIEGVQSQGVIGDVKHYALNNSETGRYWQNAIIDKRALRETDLLAFEIAVRKAKPGMVMCSYNLVNGTYACENEYLLSTVLKKEWGFQGWVISDWWATHSTVKAVLAGLDQEQPDMTYFKEPLAHAVEQDEIPMSRLNDMVHRILRTEFSSGIIDRPQPTQVPDIFRGFQVAQHVEEQSAVLLKNRDHLLPLNAQGLHSIAVIGAHADVGVLSGGGSAQVDPAGGSAYLDPNPPSGFLAALLQPKWHRSSPLRVIREMAPGVKVEYNPGNDPDSAARSAREADVAIVFVQQHTSEANDLPTLTLPDHQDELVERVVAANPKTIVVLETGAAASMPWSNKVGAILEAWYPGIRGGEAIANILFGKINPSGKLAVTFPASDQDLPRPKVQAPPGDAYPSRETMLNPPPPYDVRYDEGLKVGYKWFDAEGKKPLFAFGFGLSYTTFAFSDLKVKKSDGGLQVSVTVRNTGQRPGSDVAQVYLAFPNSSGEPPKRLIAWQKTSLAPGEERTLTMDVDPTYLSVFNPASDHWGILGGTYKVLAGDSSDDLALQTTLSLEGSK